MMIPKYKRKQDLPLPPTKGMSVPRTGGAGGGLGKGLMDLGKALGKWAAERQKRTDNREAIALSYDFSMDLMKLDAEYKSLEGDAATKAFVAYSARREGMMNDYMRRASNDEVRFNLQTWMQRSVISSTKSAYNHFNTQDGVAEENEIEKAGKLLRHRSALSPTDVFDHQDAYDVKIDALQGPGADYSLERRAQKVKSLQAAIAATAVKSPTTALDMANDPRSRAILDEYHAPIVEKLKVDAENLEADEYGNSIVEEMGDRPRQKDIDAYDKEVKANKDLNERQKKRVMGKIWPHYRQRKTLDDDAAREQREAGDQRIQKLLDAGLYAQAEAERRGLFSHPKNATHRGAVRTSIDTLSRKGVKINTDWDKYNEDWVNIQKEEKGSLKYYPVKEGRAKSQADTLNAEVKRKRKGQDDEVNRALKEAFKFYDLKIALRKEPGVKGLESLEERNFQAKERLRDYIEKVEKEQGVKAALKELDPNNPENILNQHVNAFKPSEEEKAQAAAERTANKYFIERKAGEIIRKRRRGATKAPPKAPARQSKRRQDAIEWLKREGQAEGDPNKYLTEKNILWAIEKAIKQK